MLNSYNEKSGPDTAVFGSDTRSRAFGLMPLPEDDHISLFQKIASTSLLA